MVRTAKDELPDVSHVSLEPSFAFLSGGYLSLDTGSPT